MKQTSNFVLNILLRMALFTKDSGLAANIDMAMAFKSGPMARSMKAVGSTTKLTVEESSGTQMVMYSTANGKKTKPMASASTPM